MGQEQSSEANISHEQPQKSTCRPCGDWGNKDYNTVKVDPAALGAIDKENNPNGQVLKGPMMSKEDQERERQRQEWEAEEARRAEEQRLVEEQRREMERRVKEEQARLLSEQKKREEERRRLQLEQQARERAEKERQLQEMRRQAELKRQQQEHERQEKIRLQEEARQKKIKEMDDQRKVRAWLQSNGFKNVNDLVRKRFAKVLPLHTAVGQNNPEMVKLLLAAGADPKKFNGKNESAVKLAQKLDNNGSHTAVLQAFAAQ
jgi:flagellar biosynthesis GTPase FlhF